MSTKNNAYTFDTNPQINRFKNPNIGNFLVTNTEIKNSVFFIPDITLEEAERIGFSKSEILLKLSQILGAKVIVSPITFSMHLRADQLEKELPLLHSGDSAILAFALETNSTLVTSDKDLSKCCELVGVKTINPTRLMMEVIVA